MLDFQEFAEQFQEKSPVILTNMIDDWPAVEGRWSESELVQAYGDLLFTSAHISYLDRDYAAARGITLNEFLKLSTNITDQPVHLFIMPSHQMNQHMGRSHHWIVPEIFKAIQVEGPFVAIGRDGQYIARHHHREAWNAQVFGRKRWIVAPPDASGPFLAKPCDPLPAGQHELLECVVEPREILYLPSNYHHETCTMDTFNIGVAHVGSCATWPEGHRAAVLGDMHSLQQMADKASNELFAQDQMQFRPLHWAAAKGHQEVVAFLLQKRASATVVDGRGRTSLHLGAYYGHGSVISTLVNKGIGNCHLDHRGAAPLHWAAHGGHTAIVEQLLQARASALDQDIDNQQPANVASKHGHPWLAKLLQAASASYLRSEEL